MKLKNKPAVVGMFVCIVIMFSLIALCVLLTGGRDLHEFSTTDWDIFIVFVVLEVITAVIMFILAIRVGKANVKTPQKRPETNREKNFQLRGASVFIVSLILTFAALCGSPVAEKHLPAAVLNNALWIFLGLCAVAPVLALLNHLTGNLYFRAFRKRSVRENQEFFLSHRADAIHCANKKLRLLKTLRILNDLYVAFLALIATGVCIFGSIVVQDGRVAVMFYGFFLYMCAVSRLRLPTPQKVYEDSKSFVHADEYPVLYGLARKAATAVGCKGDIKIFLWDDHTAAIGTESGYYCLYLGVACLSRFSEQEFYNILLHEFRHATYEKQHKARVEQYYRWLDQGGNPHYLSHLARHLFIFGDALYHFNHLLYSYAASISIETQADQAMAQYGDPKAAASALIKLRYADYYEWEQIIYDEESIYAPEQADPNHLTHRLAQLEKVTATQKEHWNKLIDVEILSRSASHPTTKMRLDALGVSTYETLPTDRDTPYALEVQKAVQRLDAQLYESWSKEYTENRSEIYLKNLNTVEAWEQQGKPLVAEQYADIVGALRQLRRSSEADALCCRAIETFSDAAADYAHFVHGCFLLCKYDDAGLEHIYRAIAGNSNYLEEGLELIGQFCCMTGNREALEQYRQKSVELAQQEQDLYRHIGTLEKNDRLSKENLPEGMLEDILKYILSIEGGHVSHVYLVRKTISEDFFTSAFVIRFRIGTDEEAEDEIMHKIFNYLDTCSRWQFSLFRYTEVISAKVDQIEGSCVYQAQ